MNRAEVDSLDKTALVELVLRQAERIAQLEARLAEQEQRLAELERRGVRGAAPFARPESKRSPSPKRPGRKGGHEGLFRVRPRTRKSTAGSKFRWSAARIAVIGSLSRGTRLLSRRSSRFL